MDLVAGRAEDLQERGEVDPIRVAVKVQVAVQRLGVAGAEVVQQDGQACEIHDPVAGEVGGAFALVGDQVLVGAGAAEHVEDVILTVGVAVLFGRLEPRDRGVERALAPGIECHEAHVAADPARRARGTDPELRVVAGVVVVVDVQDRSNGRRKRRRIRWNVDRLDKRDDRRAAPTGGGVVVDAVGEPQGDVGRRCRGPTRGIRSNRNS